MIAAYCLSVFGAVLPLLHHHHHHHRNIICCAIVLRARNHNSINRTHAQHYDYAHTAHRQVAQSVDTRISIR